MPVEKANEALGSSGGSSSFEALPADFYQDTILWKIYAYRVTKTDQKDKTKTYLATSLDIYFNPGLKRTNEKGEEYDALIPYSFITLSFHERSKFYALLTALGVTVSSAVPTLDYDFVGEYAGYSFRDLPLYPGTGPKGDYAIEMTHFRIEGQELHGRRLSLDVGVNDKGYNTIDSLVKSRKKPVEIGEVRAEAWSRWSCQEDALTWARDYRGSSGKPVFKTDEDLAADYKSVYDKYVASLEGAEPKREDFYRHWFEAVKAYGEGLDYDFSVDLPF